MHPTRRATPEEVFARPVATYMSTDLEKARPDTPIAELARALHGRGIGAVPIVEDGARLVGVVSRTDLIELGAMHAGRRPASPAMSLPKRTAADVMRDAPLTVSTAATIRDAARAMSTAGVHRVFVLDDNQLVGVLSAVDLAAAVRDARIDRELSTVMTAPIATLDVQSPISAAVELLERLRVTGLIVTENGSPVGMFSQADALAARDLPRSTPLDVVYDAAVISLAAETKLHRAAAHLDQLDARRIVVCKGRDAIGVVTALDLAAFIAL